MEPTVPGQLHTQTPSTNRAPFDVEELPERPQKRSLTTDKNIVAEWKYGSKARVIKYYAMYIGIGLIIGAIIGVVIGVCVRYVGK